jgi:predicted N-acetyltransferase YhbS
MATFTTEPMIDSVGLPPGFVGRAATMNDVTAVTELIAACEIANDGAIEIDASDVVQSLSSAARPEDAIVVEDGQRIVAWATIHGERTDADVHPDCGGRGIGAALLAWSEDRARAAGRPRVRQTVTDNDQAARTLFAGKGYFAAHTSWILEMPLADAPPPVFVPAGITIRPYRDDDAADVHRVIDDAFSEWPGREPLGFEDWVPHVLAHPAFSADLSRVALDGDEVVGAALAMDYAAADGWVQQLATRATHRHRGIARALLASVFVAFHAQGRRMVGLSTDSRTGALTLYQRLGMRVRRSYTGWAKDLAV